MHRSHSSSPVTIRATWIAVVASVSLGCAEARSVPSAGTAQAGGAVSRIDSVLQARAGDGMNGVIRIARGDSVLLHRAYGMRDREAGEPMRTDVGFDIGSLVKPIQAVSVIKLSELGRLTLSDTLGAYFDAPPDKAGITIEQLLRHTSGLPDIFGGDYDVVSRGWVLEQAMAADLLGPPGVQDRYSNAGYSLLAMIIEDVAGQPYEVFVREHVLRPGGTEGIGYVLPGWENEDLAVGYRGEDRWGTPRDRPWAEDGPSWNLRGNGGMLGTAEQMADWYEALFEGRILGPDALQRYYGIQAGESGSVGGLSVGHAGGNGIFNTLQVSWIDHDVHMTLFTSTSRPLNAETLWRQIRDDVVALGREAAGS